MNKQAALVARYLGSGGIATATNLGLTAVLERYTHLYYLLIISIAFISAVGVSFIMQKFFTFTEHSTHRTGHQFLAFVLIAFINLALTDFLVFLLVTFGHVTSLVLDQIIAAVFVAGYSFFVYKYGIFRTTPLP